MPNVSIWYATARPVHFPALERDITVDVAVVGGGITGMMTAHLLSAEGRSVAVLESRAVGEGTTGHSTGNLYAPMGDGLAQLAKKWGEDAMRAAARSRTEAVDRIETLARDLDIQCGFTRCGFHLFTLPQAKAEELEAVRNEADAAARAGLAARLEERAALPFPTGTTVTIDHQAQFHPLDFVRGLAARIASERCRIFQGSPVIDFDADAKAVHTALATVHAEHIVLATHTPKRFNAVQTELSPSQEHAVAVEVPPGTLRPGIFWSVEAMRHSLRPFTHDGREYVMAIGERFKTGQEPDALAKREALERWLREHLRAERVSHRWSAQGFYPADGLPYIGRSAAAENLHIATGFGADGLTYGSLAARLLADEIAGRENPFASLYRARRVALAKGGRDMARQNLEVAAHYVKDYAHLIKPGHADELKPGEGRVVQVNSRRCAVHRTAEGRLIALSPVCTHLKCIVHWNNAEKSWDCPCHGSRFAVDGSVLEGPAAQPLAPIDPGSSTVV